MDKLEFSDDGYEMTFAVNHLAVFAITLLLLDLVKQAAPSRIINVSSMAGISGNIGQVNYGTSKAGVIGFTKCLAREMARYGINVNAICPGFIDTEMTRAIPEKIRDTMIPFLQYRAIDHRLGKPEDVSKVAVFLASDESSYITGEVIRITGGAF